MARTPEAGSTSRSGTPTSQQDIQLCVEVAKDLDESATVSWNNAVLVFESVMRQYEARQVQTFLATYVEKVVHIMLDQKMSKLGQFEKQCIVGSLRNVVPIIIQRLKDKDSTYIGVVALILNKNNTLYRDYRTSMGGQYWNKGSSSTDIRSEWIALFNRRGGFELLRQNTKIQLSKQQILTSEDAKGVYWAGCERARILIESITEDENHIQVATKQGICKDLLRHLSSLTQKQLKVESTEAVTGIIELIKHLLEASILKPEFVFDAWLKLTDKYIHSTSLPLRLFGFEQVVGLLDVAKKLRPLPSAYIVRNAGTGAVNGTYVLQAENGMNSQSFSPIYSYTSRAKKTFTLFRCTMRSGAKWWFISEADQDQPGTDKDIDYYQHHSSSAYMDDNMLPPPYNWTQTGQGQLPPPEVVEDNSSIQNLDESEMLDVKLVNWVSKNRILEDIFGDRIHREIVSRSPLLVIAMVQANLLNSEDLDMIWKAAIGQEPVLVDEIYVLLATVTPHLPNKLILHLINLAKDRLDDGNISETVCFIEKVASRHLDIVLTRNTTVTEAMLQVLWETLKKLPSSSSQTHTNLVEFFRKSLRSEYGKGKRKIFLKECVGVIRLSCESGDGSLEDSVQEEDTSKVLKLLKLIIESFDGEQSKILESLGMEYNLADLLFTELEAFIKRLETCDSEAEATCHSLPERQRNAIDHRLRFIRYIYGKSQKLNLSQQDAGRLWNILSSPGQRALCLEFFGYAGTRSDDMEAAYDLEVCFYIFEELMCKGIAFDQLNEVGYQCFHTYFSGLNSNRKLLTRLTTGAYKRLAQNDTDLLGIDALWEIAFVAPTKVAESAIERVLSMYDDGTSEGTLLGRHSSDSSTTTPAGVHFLQRVFDRMGSFRGGQVQSHLPTIQHCLHLLQGFFRDATQSHTTPHGLRGQGTEMRVQIMPQFGGMSTNQMYTSSKSLELVPFSLNVHSKMTSSKLYEVIEEHIGVSQNDVKLIFLGSTMIRSNKSLEYLGADDGVELRAIVSTNYEPRSRPENMTIDHQHLDSSYAKMVANNQGYYEIMFTLLDNIEDPSIRQELAEFLESLPSNKQMWEVVESVHCNLSSNSTADMSIEGSIWNELLDHKHYHRSVYTLQIIDALLLPTESYVLLTGSPNANEQVKGTCKTDFIDRFLESNGFEHVLNFVLQKNSKFYSGHATALRIIKFCLFDAKFQDAGELLPNDGDRQEKLSKFRSDMMAKVDFPELLNSLGNLVYWENRKLRELLVSKTERTDTQQKYDNSMRKNETVARNDTSVGNDEVMVNKASLRIILDALTSIRAVIDHSPEVVAHYLHSMELQQNVLPLLLYNPSESVRAMWSKTLHVMSNLSDKIRSSIFKDLQCHSESYTEESPESRYQTCMI